MIAPLEWRAPSEELSRLFGIGLVTSILERSLAALGMTAGP